MIVETSLLATGTLIVVLLSILYSYLQKLKTYWERHHVPTIGKHIIYGIFKDVVLMKRTQGECYKDVYDKNPDLKYYGTFFYGRPTLVVQDIDIIKQILTTDFQNFSSHGFFTDPVKDPLSGNLFSLDGPKWKAMRGKLTATFTSGKMKLMLETMQKCIERASVVFDRELESRGNLFDVREKMACLGIDIIASVAFGIEVNSVENPNTTFREIGREMFTPRIKLFLRFMITQNMHWIAKTFGVRMIDSKPYDFIWDMVKNTVEFREKNNVVRNDFMNLMIQLKNQGYIEVDGKKMGLSYDESKEKGLVSRLTIEEVAAQVFVFYAAGFEPPSLLSTFILYELAIHKDIQRRVQEECDEILRANDGKITYDGIQSMVYTDKVLYETLRFFPPMGALIRATTKECILPLTDVKLDNNTFVTIPIQGIHMDPRFYPDPEKFDPERFSDEQKASRPPYTYMPFGEGPRICIGMRFALVQIKATLLCLLSKYNFAVTEDTPVPIKLHPKSVNTAPLKVDFVVTKRK